MERAKGIWKVGRVVSVLLVAIYLFPAHVADFQQSARSWERHGGLVWLTRVGFAASVLVLIVLAGIALRACPVPVDTTGLGCSRCFCCINLLCLSSRLKTPFVFVGADAAE
jgi:hypothetical protein